MSFRPQFLTFMAQFQSNASCRIEFYPHVVKLLEYIVEEWYKREKASDSKGKTLFELIMGKEIRSRYKTMSAGDT